MSVRDRLKRMESMTSIDADNWVVEGVLNFPSTSRESDAKNSAPLWFVGLMSFILIIVQRCGGANDGYKLINYIYIATACVYMAWTWAWTQWDGEEGKALEPGPLEPDDLSGDAESENDEKSEQALRNDPRFSALLREPSVEVCVICSEPMRRRQAASHDQVEAGDDIPWAEEPVTLSGCGHELHFGCALQWADADPRNYEAYCRMVREGSGGHEKGMEVGLSCPYCRQWSPPPAGTKAPNTVIGAGTVGEGFATAGHSTAASEEEMIVHRSRSSCPLTALKLSGSGNAIRVWRKASPRVCPHCLHLQLGFPRPVAAILAFGPTKIPAQSCTRSGRYCVVWARLSRLSCSPCPKRMGIECTATPDEIGGDCGGAARRGDLLTTSFAKSTVRSPAFMRKRTRHLLPDGRAQRQRGA